MSESNFGADGRPDQTVQLPSGGSAPETLPDLASAVATRLLRGHERTAGLRAVEMPERIGRYELVAKLGAGGMGVVYTARDPDLGREVAVKLLHVEAAGTRGGEPQLVREAKALAKLSHPNVVHVYEVGVDAGRVFVAMEKVDGPTLRVWGQVKRSWREILRMHVAAGRGLAAAHAAGLVHRDYKLDNVIVGEDGRPRVLDFGLARPESDFHGFVDPEELAQSAPSLDAAAPQLDITAAGSLLGTPAYMAPEQLRGEDVDARADQFSFCVALFEGLYGTRPFPGSTLSELVDRVLHRPPLKVDGRRDVPEAIRAALVRGLARTPADRFDDITELLGQLEATVRRHPPRSFARWAGAGLVAAAVLGVGALAVTTPRGRTAGEAPVAGLVATARVDTPSASTTAPLDVADPAGVTVHKLDNGLTVYIAPRVTGALVQGRVVMRSDSRDERPGQEGFSSMVKAGLETGTARLGAVDIDEETPGLAEEHTLIEKLAATEEGEVREGILVEVAEIEDRINKRNSPEFIRGLVRLDGDHMGSSAARTEYRSDVPPGRVGAWIDFHAEIMRHPIFRAPLGAARWNLRLLGSLVWSDASLLAARKAFAPNPAAFDPTTVATNLRRLPVQELRDYHAAYFRPENMALVFVGEVDAEQIVPAVREAFGDWQRGTVPKTPEVDYAAMPDRVALQVTMPGPQTLRVGWPVDAMRAQGATWSDIDALVSALDGHDGLLASSIVREGLAVDAKPELEGGVFSVLVKTNSGVDEAQLEARVLAALGAIAAGEVDAGDWDAAEAQRRFAMSAWESSSDEMAGMIVQAFLRRQAWHEVAAQLADTGSGRVGIARAAVAAMAVPRVVVSAKPGPSPVADVPAFPTGRSLRPESEEMSPFLRDLIARPFTRPEPQFLVAGRNYTQAKIGNIDAVLVPRPGRRFDVRIVFGLGAVQEPWACDAMRAKVSAAKRARTLLGTNLSVLCSRAETALKVEGLDQEFERIWPAVVAWLERAAVSPADQARYLAELADDRRSAADDPYQLALGLGLRGIQDGEDLSASLPSNAELAGAKAGTFSLALSRMTAGPVRLAYIGPRPDTFVTAKAPPSSGSVALAPAAPRSAKPSPVRPTIHIIDHPSEKADVRIAIRRLRVATPKQHVLARLVAVGVPTAPLPEERDSQLWHYGLQEGRAIRAPRRDLYTFGYSARPADVVLAISIGFETAATLPELVTMQRTRHAVETEIRMARVQEVEIPSVVADWQRLGLETDPIIEQWLALPSLTVDELTAYTQALAAVHPAITIVADKRRLDLPAIAKLGELVWVDADSVVRDPTMGEYALLGYWDE